MQVKMIVNQKAQTTFNSKTNKSTDHPAIEFEFSGEFNKHNREDFLATMVKELFWTVDRARESKLRILRANQPTEITLIFGNGTVISTGDADHILAKAMRTKMLVKGTPDSRLTFLYTCKNLFDLVSHQIAGCTFSELCKELLLQKETLRIARQAEEQAKIEAMPSAEGSEGSVE